MEARVEQGLVGGEGGGEMGGEDFFGGEEMGSMKMLIISNFIGELCFLIFCLVKDCVGREGEEEKLTELVWERRGVLRCVGGWLR